MNNDFLNLVITPNFNPDEYLNYPGNHVELSDEQFLEWKNSEPVQTFLQNCKDTKAAIDNGEPLPDVPDGDPACLFGCVFAYSICMGSALTQADKDRCLTDLWKCKQKCNNTAS